MENRISPLSKDFFFNKERDSNSRQSFSSKSRKIALFDSCLINFFKFFPSKKTEGIADAVVNFMTQKMIVEFAEGSDPKTVMQSVLKACKKVEPDCEIEL